MRIGLSSVLVDDQEKALAFYTEKPGFLKKTDIPADCDNGEVVIGRGDESPQEEGEEELIGPSPRQGSLRTRLY